MLFVVMLLGYALTYAQPKIRIEGDDVYDWGKTDPKDQPLTAKIKIFNQGTDTLKISLVKPECGCTTAPLDKNNIEPHGFATLSVRLSVGGEDGPVDKSIAITSNDPVSPQKNLSLKADIIRPIRFSSRILLFGSFELNKEATSSLTIKNNTGKTIHIRAMKKVPKEVMINIKKNVQIAPNKEFTLKARYTPGALSNLSGKLTLKTDNEEMETVEILFLGSFPPAKKK